MKCVCRRRPACDIHDGLACEVVRAFDHRNAVLQPSDQARGLVLRDIRMRELQVAIAHAHDMRIHHASVIPALTESLANLTLSPTIIPMRLCDCNIEATILAHSLDHVRSDADWFIQVAWRVVGRLLEVGIRWRIDVNRHDVMRTAGQRWHDSLERGLGWLPAAATLIDPLEFLPALDLFTQIPAALIPFVYVLHISTCRL
mmetsp:Transcript_113789/g.200807  ORF Transcript_113789/g.200807 Transcript_113789/m.200807 type:complete len:201 (+) Transcript_113789:448-1050(+)